MCASPEYDDRECLSWTGFALRELVLQIYNSYVKWRVANLQKSAEVREKNLEM